MNHKGIRDPMTAQRAKTLAYWLIISISVLIAVILFFLDHESSVDVKLSAVGASLLGAAVFGALVALLFNRESDFHFEASLRSILQEHLLDWINSTKSTSRLHVPSSEYAPTENFDPAFMLDLMDDISVSSKFWLRGSTGKWIGPYLNYCRKPPVETKVLILDPSDELAIRQRAADRKRTEKNANRTIKELIQELRHEIKMGIVSIYDARHRSKIEIILSGSTSSTVGIDLTDKAVYVGLHITGPGPSARNPISYRYEKDSLAYLNYSVELVRQSDLARYTIKFNHNSTHVDLIESFKTIGMNDIEIEEIEQLRKEANKFQEQFFNNMKNATR